MIETGNIADQDYLNASQELDRIEEISDLLQRKKTFLKIVLHKV